MGRHSSSDSSVAVWCVVSVCLFSLPVQAQENRASKAERAQQHADRGAKRYAEENYSEALVEFRRAHSLKPNPILLFNIGLTYSKLGRCGEAIERGEELRREHELPGKLATTNDGMMAACRRVMKARDVAGDLVRVADAQTGQTERRKRTSPDASDVGIDSTPPSGKSSRSSVGTLGWVGVASAGLGAAGGVGTLIVRSQIQRDWQRYKRAAQRGDRATYTRLNRSLKKRQRTGKVLMYTSAGLLAAGGTLLMVDLLNGPSPEREEVTAAITGFVGPNQTYVGLIVPVDSPFGQ